MNKPNSGAAGIEFRDVSFSYGRNPVLKQISFKISPSRTTVLFGPSGAGKTTCLRLVAGFEQPQSGAVFIDGREVASSTKSVPACERGVGFCFQEAALWAHLRVRDHVMVPLRSASLSKAERERRVEEILKAFSLHELAGRYPEQLSGGERKRLEFARAAASEPPILVLDEPLAGADEPRRHELMPYIRACGGNGRTLVVVTHHREEAFALADDLVVFNAGRILRSGRVENVFRNPQSKQAAALLGYRTMVDATIKDEMIHTPYGEWPAPDGDAGDGFAGWTMDAIAVSADGPLAGVVESCEFIGRGYRVTLRHDGLQLIGASQCAASCGETARFTITQAPVWISRP
ncbi:MAG: ABC transporter ATP-binding protein [Candidatus Hinthialibacter antarcticus]|nr:ABC transporter ATP-binding protein [Candidatus Hinthialibacter antarcticus]